MHLNIKYLSDEIMVEIAKTRSSFLVATSGLKSAKEALHLTWWRINRQISEMLLPSFLGKRLWDLTEGFIDNGVIKNIYIYIYIYISYNLFYLVTEWCNSRALDSDLNTDLGSCTFFGVQPLCWW